MSVPLIQIGQTGDVGVSKPVPYLYSVLRLVPDIERGESINVGLVMFCRPQRFLKVDSMVDQARIEAFCNLVDLDLVTSHLDTYATIAAADRTGGPVSELDLGERFHWLTNISNTMIQPDPVHTGLTTDAEATFARLFERLVKPIST